MRARLMWLAAALLLGVGCAKTPEPDLTPATPEEEKAEEQRMQEQNERESKIRREQEKRRKKQKADPDA